MKKLLGILVLGLLWCNVGFTAELNDTCIRKGTKFFDEKVKIVAKSSTNKNNAVLMYFGCASNDKWYWSSEIADDLDKAHEKGYSRCSQGASEYGIKKCHLFSIGDKIVYGKDAAFRTKIEEKLRKKLAKKKRSGATDNYVHKFLLWDNVIFTKNNPTTFKKLKFNEEKNVSSITKRVARNSNWDKKKTFRSFNFTAEYEENISIEIFIEYEKDKKDFKKAEKEALFFSHMYGQMPSFLKTYNDKIYLHNDNGYDDGLGLWWVGFKEKAFHMNPPRIDLKPSGQHKCTSGKQYSHCATVMVHELAHVIQQLTGVISPSKWGKARKLDKKKYASAYAKKNSMEDFAESILAWIAVRHKSDKISKSDLAKFNEFIPSRLKFFDEMNFNMYPL